MCQCINKVVLVVVNVAFALVGAAIAGVSIWVLVGSSSLFDLMKLVTKDVNVDDSTLNNYMSSTSMLTAAAWVLLGFGALSLVVGICGCIGAMCGSKILLGLYAFFVCLILIAEIAGAIVIAVFKSQVASELQPRLKSLESRHFLPLNVSLSDDKNTSAIITALINYAQVSFSCCGVNNQSDITGNDTVWTSVRDSKSLNLKVPVTCCPMKDKEQLLSRNDWSNYVNYLSDANCPSTGANSITVGCYDQFENYLNTYTLPIIVVAIIVALCEILCVVMACSLIQSLRNKESEHV